MTTLRTNTRDLGPTDRDRIDREILLVEDQRSLALAAAKMLHERWGCRVLIATTLEQVRTIIAQAKHDFFVAISDLNLPDAHDGEVVDVLVAADIRVIAVTGAFDRDMLDKFMRKGVIDYVLKNSINAYEYVVELVGRLHRNTRIKVLVVDDSKSICAGLRRMLKMQCLETVVASDGAEALKVLERQHNDIKLVLVDYRMPGMDGLNFLATVRRQFGKDKLSVIGMSATDDKAILAQFLKLGANDFISKPFSYEELVCRISHNLQMMEDMEAVSYVAHHDHLTGLLNRRAFFEQGGNLHDKQAAKVGSSGALAVAMMDIDFFKRINDGHGHDGGDAALKHFAALFGSCFAKDMTARLGGEEFALLMRDTDQAVGRCEAFRRQVEQSPAQFGGKSIPFTVSIGITHQLQSSLDATLKLADENLYRAKSTGRNCIVSS